MMKHYFLTLILFLACAASPAAKVAVFGAGSALIQAELTGDDGVELYERAEIDRALGELELTALIRSYPHADVFAVAEAERLVVFDARRSWRLADCPLPRAAEERTAQAAREIRRALAKTAPGRATVPVAFLERRDAGVPESFHPDMAAAAERLEQLLLTFDGLVLLERERLETVSDERRLTGESHPLDAAVQWIGLEFSFSRGLELRWQILRPDGKTITGGPDSSLEDAAGTIAAWLLRDSGPGGGAAEEAARFSAEGDRAFAAGNLSAARSFQAAARALAPDDHRYFLRFVQAAIREIYLREERQRRNSTSFGVPARLSSYLDLAGRWFAEAERLAALREIDDRESLYTSLDHLFIILWELRRNATPPDAERHRQLAAAILPHINREHDALYGAPGDPLAPEAGTAALNHYCRSREARLPRHYFPDDADWAAALAQLLTGNLLMTRDFILAKPALTGEVERWVNRDGAPLLFPEPPLPEELTPLPGDYFELAEAHPSAGVRRMAAWWRIACGRLCNGLSDTETRSRMAEFFQACATGEYAEAERLARECDGKTAPWQLARMWKWHIDHETFTLPPPAAGSSPLLTLLEELDRAEDFTRLWEQRRAELAAERAALAATHYNGRLMNLYLGIIDRLTPRQAEEFFGVRAVEVYRAPEGFRITASAVAGDELYFTLERQGELVLATPASEILRLEMPGSGSKRALFAADGLVFIGDREESRLRVVDPRRRRLIREIELPARGLTALTAAGGRVYLFCGATVLAAFTLPGGEVEVLTSSERLIQPNAFDRHPGQVFAMWSDPESGDPCWASSTGIYRWRPGDEALSPLLSGRFYQARVCHETVLLRQYDWVMLRFDPVTAEHTEFRPQNAELRFSADMLYDGGNLYYTVDRPGVITASGDWLLVPGCPARRLHRTDSGDILAIGEQTVSRIIMEEP